MSPADSPFAPLSAPGPHPATAELRAYAAGTLAPADEHCIEAHTLDCERCAELLDGFAMTDAATTDQALAELRARLQARVGADLALPVAPLAASRPLWPRLAAAVALLGAIGAGLWGWEHQPAAEHVVAMNQSGPRPTATTGSVAQAPSPGNAAASAPSATTDAASAAVPAVSAAAVANRGAAAGASPAPVHQPTADYAVLSPRRRSVGLVPPAQQADREELAAATSNAADDSPDAVAATSSDEQLRETLASRTASAAPAAAKTREAPALGRAEAAAGPAVARLARPSAAAPSDQIATTAALAADSTQDAKKEVVIAAGKAKMANSPAGQPGNSVRVLDKSMPAAPAIVPAPVGGTPALKEYLRRQATGFEPEENARHLPGGFVKVRFVVGADGKVNNLQVVRGLRADYDAEALRIICEGPAWRPGIANGRRAALPMELTIGF